MQTALLKSCVQGRLCSPNFSSSLGAQFRHGAGSLVAQQLPLRRSVGGEAITAAAAELSSSASLFSGLSVRSGLLASKVQPKAHVGGSRVRASGAYSKDAFVNEREASTLAQVRILLNFCVCGYAPCTTLKSLERFSLWGCVSAAFGITRSAVVKTIQ